MDLTVEQRSALITLYQSHSVLWDNRLVGYRNLSTRNQALAAIIDSFEAISGIRLDVNSLKTKLRGFRTSLTREVSRVIQSERSGAGADDIYVPTFAHWRELQFLRDVIKKRESTSNLPQWSEKQEEEDKLTCTETEDGQDSSSHSQTVRPQTPQAEHSQTSQILPTTPCSRQSVSQTDLPSKKRKRDASDAALNSICHYFENKQKNANTEDSDMIWAKNLIENLKKIRCEESKTILKFKMNRLVEDQLLKEMNVNME